MTDTDRETVIYMLRVSQFTGKTAAQVLKLAWRGIQHVRTTGQQSYRMLNRSASRTGASLASMELPEDCQGIIRDLRRYGVDFSVFKDKVNGGQVLFFKAANYETVNKAFETAIARAAAPERTPFRRLMKSAREKAASLNAGRAPSVPNLSQQHSVPVR